MGIWNATSHGNHFYGTSTLPFAPGATITVDMGDRTVELNDQLTGKAAFQAAGAGRAQNRKRDFAHHILPNLWYNHFDLAKSIPGAEPSAVSWRAKS